MESKTRWGRCLALLVAGVSVAAMPSTAVPGAAAEHPAQVVHVAQLARGGQEAGVPWLAGNVLHTARGGTVTMPWTDRAAREKNLSLVGHSRRGWLLRDVVGTSQNLWRVTAGRRTRLYAAGASEGESYSYAVSDDGRRFVVEYFDGDRHSSLSVHGLGGRRLATREFADLPGLLAFSGPQVVVGASPAQLWSVDDGTLEDLGVEAVGADLARDVLFATVTDGRTAGPTPLSDPGVPRWTAALAQPVVSPGGGRVLGRDHSGGDVLTVRHLATGRVRISFSVRFLASEAPVWVNNHAFVFVGSAGSLGDREALVRCSLSGRCVRVSAIRQRGVISLPR